MKLHELDENDFIVEFNRWVENTQVDYDFVIEEFIQDIKPYVIDVDVEWSGFWSQGDGASFTGSVDILKVLDLIDTDNEHYLYRELMRADELWKTATVTRSHSRYSHEMKMQLDNVDTTICSRYVPKGPLKGLDLTGETEEGEMQEVISACVDAGSAAVLEWCRDKARELYRKLEQEYEYQTSREMFIEWAEANEVEFDYEKA